MGEPSAMEGRCLCGAVRISVSSPREMVEICHCDMCRRWGGAFYAALECESFVIEGEHAVTTYRSSEWAERAFCGTCGCNVWWRFLPTGNRSFHAGLFADADGFAVGKEIFTDERAHWADLTGTHPRETGAEVIAAANAAGFTFE